MIVRLNTESNDKGVIDNSWLSPEVLYHVIGITTDANNKPSYNVVFWRNSGIADLISASEKEVVVVSSIQPSNWTLWREGNSWGLSPASMQNEQFMDRFVDGEPVTITQFLKEMKVIQQEDPLPSQYLPLSLAQTTP